MTISGMTSSGMTTGPEGGSCPKRMVFGPCGGVRPDGSCEMRPGPCAFPGPVGRSDTVAGVPLARVPRVLTDLSTPPYDPTAVEKICRILAPGTDALLIGEHHNRPDFPPTLLARMVQDHGGRPWVTLACRDRNRITLEQELRGLRLLDVDACLCVTGDGRGADVFPGVQQVFELDGVRLTELAADIGIAAAVPETPLAPPTHLRPERLVIKQRSGASVAVLNHVASAADVAAFVTRARELGLHIPVIAAVAVYTDERSVRALQGLPGLALDPASVASVLSADDPVEAGIDLACAEARELLAVPGVVGVNLSGLGSGRGLEFAAEIKTRIGARVRADTP